ncbi:MAG: HtaA domain-containing protein [Propionicimonas sp.]|uniref:HtaA domain-containing protein n=1 Tax=Propionicimonas sp. TaxID=1955623 RepID=UPI003D14C237
MSIAEPTPRGGRRLLGLGLAAALAAGSLVLAAPEARAADDTTPTTTILSGSISWGLKASFRGYLTGFAAGSVTAADPATDDGTQTTFPVDGGSWGTTTGSATGEGAVTFTGHAGVLNLTISDPEVTLDAEGAELVVDATDSDGNTYTDLAIATLDLTSALTRSGATVTISDAPATLTEAGSAVFTYSGHPMYAAGTVLDAVDATLTVAQTSITVSKVSVGTDETATVTVTGSGFFPGDSIAARPPLAGKSSGLYVAFGKFADAWAPSAGATSATRKNSSVRWAVLAADMATIGGPAAGAVELKADGTFTAELTVSKAEIDAVATDPSLVNYGVYTYPGGGAVKAGWEHYTPITFYDRSVSKLSLSAPSVTFGRTAKVSVGVSPSSATGTVVLSGAGDDLTATLKKGKATFTVPAGLPAGKNVLTVAYSGDDVRASVSKTVTLTVKKASTSTTLKTRTTAYGTAPVVTVKVSKSASGQVKLTGAGAAITADVVDGLATVTLPADLKPGKRTLKATYVPDANHTGSSDKATLTVKKAAAKLAAVVDTVPTPAAAGQATVTLSGAEGATVPTGKVTLRVSKGSKSYTVTGKLVDGAAVLAVRKLPVGTWKAAVKYTGDARYASAGYSSVGTVVVTA